MKLLGKFGRNLIPRAKATLSEIPQAVPPIIFSTCWSEEDNVLNHNNLMGKILVVFTHITIIRWGKMFLESPQMVSNCGKFQWCSILFSLFSTAAFHSAEI